MDERTKELDPETSYKVWPDYYYLVLKKTMIG